MAARRRSLAISMPSRSLHSRLGALVVLAVVSLFWLAFLLGGEDVGGRLMEIAVGKGKELIDGGREGLLKWVDGGRKEVGDGDGGKEGDGEGEGKDDLWQGDGGGSVRLVVFGNSVVASEKSDGKNGKKKKAWKNWVEVLCEELNCTSLLNFAASQTKLSPSPTGSLVSNDIYLSSLRAHFQAKNTTSSSHPPLLLDDLPLQTRAFHALPPPSSPPDSTIFILNFGLWEIYHLASLDYEIAKNATDLMITEFFTQLDILYSYYAENISLYHRHQPPLPRQDTNGTDMPTSQIHIPPRFNLIIPELFDPTLLPGWTSRPTLQRPDNPAEELRHAVSLTERWNTALSKQVKIWAAPLEKSKTESSFKLKTLLGMADDESSAEVDDKTADAAGDPVYLEKDVFFATTTPYIMDNMVNTHLQQQNISDGGGLGTQQSVFRSINEPCIRATPGDDGKRLPEDGRTKVDGKWICKNEEEYLFWDDWTLGSTASGIFGRGVRELLRKREE